MATGARGHHLIKKRNKQNLVPWVSMPSTTSHTLAKLLELLAREIHSDSASGGVAPGQRAIVRYLAKTPRTARSPSQIATYLGVEVSAISRALSSLERKELVTTVVAGDSPRNFRYLLSAEGIALAATDPVARLSSAIGRFPPANPQELGRWLSSIIADLASKARG
jgi:DNA-binding MarR family transcriptional regulator